MELVASITDPWVTRYDALNSQLKILGIPGEKFNDSRWLINNLKNYCFDIELCNTLLKEIYDIHNRY